MFGGGVIRFSEAIDRLEQNTHDGWGGMLEEYDSDSWRNSTTIFLLHVRVCSHTVHVILGTKASQKVYNWNGCIFVPNLYTEML
jgi:hypothetical protein